MTTKRSDYTWSYRARDAAYDMQVPVLVLVGVALLQDRIFHTGLGMWGTWWAITGLAVYLFLAPNESPKPELKKR